MTKNEALRMISNTMVVIVFLALFVLLLIRCFGFLFGVV